MGKWDLWDILFPLLDKVYFHVIYKIRILSIFEKVKLRSVNYFYLLTLDV